MEEWQKGVGVGGQSGKEERWRVGMRGKGALGGDLLPEGVQKFMGAGASIAGS